MRTRRRILRTGRTIWRTRRRNFRTRRRILRTSRRILRTNRGILLENGCAKIQHIGHLIQILRYTVLYCKMLKLFRPYRKGLRTKGGLNTRTWGLRTKNLHG